MARLISRIYLDFNSTSPLASSVTEYLSKGDFFWANPSSSHTSGKKSRKFINEAKNEIRSCFNLQGDFDLFFHSGATEGINTFVKGYASKNPKSKFFFMSTDHSAVIAQSEYLKHFECSLSLLPVLKDGEINFSLIDSDQTIFLNITRVNNETGFVIPLAPLGQLKKKFGDKIFIHLDCAQTPFKTLDWNIISEDIDAATFSGHKFGALKGVGFSFFKKNRIQQIEPLISGGGQEDNLRSGTENILAIVTIAMALKEGMNKFNSLKYNEVISYRNKIEKIFEEVLGDKIYIIRPKDLKLRSSNTVLVLFKEKKSDELLIHFDLAGIDVGTGSACTSLSSKPSRVLLNMGYNEKEARSGIRISIDYFLDATQFLKIEEALTAVLKKLK